VEIFLCSSYMPSSLVPVQLYVFICTCTIYYIFAIPSFYCFGSCIMSVAVISKGSVLDEAQVNHMESIRRLQCELLVNSGVT
jgi:hypothetical protein